MISFSAETVAAMVQEAKLETARRCAEIAERRGLSLKSISGKYEKDHRYYRAEDAERLSTEALQIAGVIRREFGLE